MRAIATLLIPALCFAQAPAQPPAKAPKRHAFLVANSDYQGLLPALPEALDSARMLGTELAKTGFRVVQVENARMPDLLTKHEADFLKDIGPGDVVLFYYFGYAVQGDDEDDYLLPSGFDPKNDIREGANAFHLTRLLQDLSDKGAGLKMVLIEGPPRLAVPINGSAGLGLIAPDTRDLGEVLFANSVQPRQVLTPDANGRSNLFTREIVTQLGRPGLLASDVFERAKENVMRATNQRQSPFVVSKISSQFYFREPEAPRVEPPPPPPPQQILTNRTDRQEYVHIAAGKFKMGCVPADTRCEAGEKPQHAVELKHGFYIGRTEVQVGAYQLFANAKKLKLPGAPIDYSHWNVNNLPMVLLPWDRAHDFCVWAGGRLPTEAEWEYAARGGATDEVYPLNDENSRDKANFYGKKGNDIYEGAAPVGKFDENPFKLFDMAGNVWEWVQDWYSPGYFAESPAEDPPGPAAGKEHVIRGGSFESDPKEHLRLSVRKSQGGGSFKVGFRCALDEGEETDRRLNVR